MAFGPAANRKGWIGSEGPGGGMYRIVTLRPSARSPR